MLLDSGAVRFGDFVLTSGRHSDVYVDVKQLSTRPDRLARIASSIAARAGAPDRLAGVELGAVPILVAVALGTGRPYVILRKPGRDHGTGRRIEGELPVGATVLLIEDVTTTGGSLAEAVGVLRGAGAVVERAITVVDRNEGGRERLAALGVTLESLATLAELREPEA